MRSSAGSGFDGLPIERERIRAELDQARVTFHQLVESASNEQLDRPSHGTRWTNRQLLFHMMLGYMVVLSLLPVVKGISRLPAGIGRAAAAVLNAGAPLFDWANYWGSVAGSRLYRDHRLAAKFDVVVAALERRLGSERDSNMTRSTAYPVRWDPFFKNSMTLADVYHYPTQHFAFHRRQLTLSES
jgi:hypothetical protein